MYFKSDLPIAVNDLPVILKWKVKNAWKVEIENIGVVKAKGIIILNNIHHHSQVTLKAYGWRGNYISEFLDLNHQTYNLQPYLRKVIENKHVSQELISLGVIIRQWEQELKFHESMLSEFYESEINTGKEPEMVLVNEQPRVVETHLIEGTLNLLDVGQQIYFIKEMKLQNPENYKSENLFQ